MKLCNECRYYAPSVLQPTDQHNFAKCIYGTEMKVSPVTGEEIMAYRQTLTYCVGLRRSTLSMDCGAEGKFYEPKRDPIANCVENAMRDLLTDAVRP